MNFQELYKRLDEVKQMESLNFAADPNLKALIFQRLTAVEREIADTEPGVSDPTDYTRRMQDLHARKDELKDFSKLLQEIANRQKQPQQNRG